MIAASLRAPFSAVAPQLKRIGEHVKDVLLSYCAENPGSAFLERYKTIESLSEKLEGGRVPNWTAIDDLYAATLIVPTLIDEPAAHAFIRDKFYVRGSKLRGESRKSPEQFRFEAPRFQCTLRAPSGLESEPLYQQLFEIQTRSAFEHAWSVTTHKLSYKAPVIDWRVQRVAAQLRAAIEQLDTIILSYDSLVTNVAPSPDDRVETQARVTTALREWATNGLVPTTSLPSSVGRLGENVYALFSGVQGATVGVRVDAALGAAEQWLRTPGRSFPRSVSVFQFILGVSAESKLLAPRGHYCYYVSDEARSLFPATRTLTPCFTLVA